ncbi:MAG: RidA/YER057c/UK114 superfamily, group 7, YjgH-like protein, partial [uncultured Sphingomonadaceae bacterium]
VQTRCDIPRGSSGSLRDEQLLGGGPLGRPAIRVRSGREPGGRVPRTGLRTAGATGFRQSRGRAQGRRLHVGRHRGRDDLPHGPGHAVREDLPDPARGIRPSPLPELDGGRRQLAGGFRFRDQGRRADPV